VPDGRILRGGIRAHFAVDCFDCPQNGVGVRANRHFMRFGIDAIANFWTVAPQLLDKFDDLRNLLFCERCEFEGHLSTDIGEPVGVSLSHKDEDRHHQSRHGGGEFKPGVCEQEPSADFSLNPTAVWHHHLE